MNSKNFDRYNKAESGLPGRMFEAYKEGGGLVRLMTSFGEITSILLDEFG